MTTATLPSLPKNSRRSLRRARAGVPTVDLVRVLRWSKYTFPRWVPEDVREQLRSFWSEEWGRSPAEWYRSTVEDPYNKHPRLGTRVTCEGMWRSDRHKKFKGRWVPMWNNIGRLVRANGEVLVMSTGCILSHPNTEAREPGQTT